MKCSELLPESEDLGEYLECTEIVDWQAAEIRGQAEALGEGAASDLERVRRIYEWVRDEIPHSADASHETVTCRASEVLRCRTGLCFAKAHLVAAMLRAAGIPAGFCYQVLRYDARSTRLVLHGLNGVYLASAGRWIRLDARGNKPGIEARFSPGGERLAFVADPALGESTMETVFVRPLPVVLRCLMSYSSVTELLANLPDGIG
ncbi:MAG: transglutaminase-like domain-containing protein [Thermoguttaceae bacterium]|nr:transglutaminase-like domain-containing protein [Thermoguttaceae bacterium]